MNVETLDSQNLNDKPRHKRVKHWFKEYGAPKDVQRTNKFLMWLAITMIVLAVIVFSVAVYKSTPKSFVTIPGSSSV